MTATQRKPLHRQPGREVDMQPQPHDLMTGYRAAGKLEGKVALITGGDSGIGRATAIGFAMEGADVAIVYLEEDQDAALTKEYVENLNAGCLLIRGDIGDEAFCLQAVKKTIDQFGKLDILVNSAAEQHVQEDFTDITAEQIDKTFRTNLFSMFYLTRAALQFMKKGASIINTASITAYHGHDTLIDYSATKGGIVSFTRSLSGNLAKKGIRVNAVAPGPIWTPLIPSTFKGKKLQEFGKDTPLGRAGQPDEVAPCFIFLASDDASYITGQVLHPNGGSIING